MKLKIIILIGIIMVILMFALFGFGLKELAVKKIVEDIPEYECGGGDICMSCTIEGHSCSCGKHTCDCGNKTVDREECILK